MVPENFIALLAQNNGAEARTVLEDGLANIVLNRLEERKRELAGGLFSGYATEPVQEEFEQLDESPNTEELGPDDWARAVKVAKKNGSWQSHHAANPGAAVIPHPDKPGKYARYIQQSTIDSHGRDRSDVDKFGRRRFHEESEQLDEISTMRAHSLGKKRFALGISAADSAASAKKDPRHWAQSAKQLTDRADVLFRKSKKAFDYATKKDGLKEESEQLDEISLKTKTSAYAKAVERDSPKGDNFAGKIEKNVEKKHGPDGVQKLYNAADRYMYGNKKK